MIRILSAALMIAFGTTAVLAQDTPYDKRKASMRAISKAGKTIKPMRKGEAPFNLATIKAALKVFADEAKKSKGLYPAGSNVAKSRAKPEVWKDNKDFLARFDKFAAAATKASATINKDNYKAELKAVAKNCGGCHKIYRGPKKKKK